MKILLLAKFEEIDEFLLDFLKKIHKNLPIEVELLHVVNSYPQVPLQKDGRIIDICVDYDLSELEAKKKKGNEKAIQLQDRFSFINLIDVSIGSLDRIIKHKLENSAYDFIVLGAHKTDLFEDLTHESTVSRILEISSLPVLSLKCDQSHNVGIDNIGLFDDYRSYTDLPKLGKLAKAMDTKIHMFCFVESTLEGQEEMERKRRMTEFAKNNGFENFETHVIQLGDLSDEDAIIKTMTERNLQLIVVNQMQPHKFSWMFNKSLKSNIADHIYAPLLIY
jgi:hypothetical protein